MRTIGVRVGWLWVCGLVFGIGCDSTPLADGLPADISCISCHGSEENAAPPRSVNEQVSRASIGVGAHQAHLQDTTLRLAIDCAECHVVPSSVEQEGHIDPLPAEVMWGELAAANNSSPRWEREEARCSGTYCHGATLAGGSDTAPVWTSLDGLTTVCDACHGNPPPAPHPNLPNCAICHSATLLDDSEIDVAGNRHINGVADGP